MLQIAAELGSTVQDMKDKAVRAVAGQEDKPVKGYRRALELPAEDKVTWFRENPSPQVMV